jgi:ABC-2 type transport system permease protein
MIISPTSRGLILFGKLVSVVVIVLIQLLFLFVGFTVIGSLLEGRFQSIWGDNLLLIAVLMVATTLATAGVGMITAAVGKTPEQANIIGSIVSMLMGILGGAFFTVNVLGDLEFITRISVVRWGSEGFSKLAAGQTDILSNIFFLALLGAVFFGISLLIFNRRKDV